MQHVSPEILDRLPPQDLDAEKGVLGSIILQPSRIADIEPLLRSEDFYADAHSQLYRALAKLCDRPGQKLDSAILLDHLRQTKQLEVVGGAAYIAEVTLSVPYAANAEHYAEIVARKSALRQMIHAATELLRSAYDEEDATETLDRAERALAVIGAGTDKAHGPMPFQEVMAEAIEHIDEVIQTGTGLGVATGMLGFDRYYGGLFPGELTILAARPTIGKTALATQIAAYAARKGPVYYASAEMSRVELATRLLCGTAGVSSQRVRGGTLDRDDVTRLTECSRLLAPAALYIDDCAGQGVRYIERASRRLLRGGLRLIVIDYLQLLEPEDTKVNREQQVSTMSRRLKLLARELDVPVLCLCQLNRQATGNCLPELYHLRESGAIEQDADVVSFLHLGPSNPTQDNHETFEPHDARWLIRKNRNGEIGTVRMRWSSTLVGFESVAERPL